MADPGFWKGEGASVRSTAHCLHALVCVRLFTEPKGGGGGGLKV